MRNMNLFWGGNQESSEASRASRRAKVAGVLATSEIVATLIAGCGTESSDTARSREHAGLSAEQMQERGEEMVDYDCAVVELQDTREQPFMEIDGRSARTQVNFAVRLTSERQDGRSPIDDYAVGGILHHEGREVTAGMIRSNFDVIGGTFEGSASDSVDENGNTIIETQFFPRKDTGVSDPQIDMFVFRSQSVRGENGNVWELESAIPCGTVKKSNDGEAWVSVPAQPSNIVRGYAATEW